MEKVAKLIPADVEESQEEFVARLKTVANRKLLRLVAIGEEAEGLGGRDGLIEKIATLKGQAKDAPYRTKLAGLTLPRLLDVYKRLELRARKPKKGHARSPHKGPKNAVAMRWKGRRG